MSEIELSPDAVKQEKITITMGEKKRDKWKSSFYNRKVKVEVPFDEAQISNWDAPKIYKNP